MHTGTMARTLIALIIVFAIFASLVVIGWYFVGESIRSQPEYRLKVERITVSPPPIWVPECFVENVLRTSGLDRTGSLLDRSIDQKLMEAFVTHPWVERVERIELRYPSGADVRLSYRIPVALVEIPGRNAQGRNIVPVDRHGVVLPQEFLTDTLYDRRSEHFVIQGIQSLPLGSVGTPWGDPLVQTAAQLADALTDVAEPLTLAQIVLASGGTWRLQTVAGTEFHWGPFAPGEQSIETKKKRLRDLHDQFRSLDNVPENLRDLNTSQ